MHLQPILLIGVCWAVFVAYWLYAARGVKRPKLRQPVFQRFVAYFLMILCAVLLAFPPARNLPLLGVRAWPAGPAARWLGVAICMSGIAFAISARRVLADNWSADVQIKEDHALVTRGPYGVVRHPIYTGIFAALIGTWITIGSLVGLLAIGIAFLGLWHKMTLEEQFMRMQFPEAYPRYASRVKRLIPGVF